MKNVIWLLAISVLISCKKDAVTSNATYTVSVKNNAEQGIVLVSPYSNSQQNVGHLMMYDLSGKLLQSKDLPGAAFDFRKWTVNGQARYTYAVNDVNAYHIQQINQLTGYWVIADSALNEIKKIHLHAYGDITTGSNAPDLDVHDIILVDDNHYYVMAFYPRQVTNIPASLNPATGVTVVAAIIQEIVNDQVVWQWESDQYPEFYTNSVEGNDFTNTSVAQDYMHMNSMIIDPKDGNLIISFRNQNQVIKVNKQTKEIMWRLGGKDSDFPLQENQQILRQHNTTLTDNNQTLLIFDNGEKTLRPQTRIVEFNLDEAAKTVTGFKEFAVPEPFTQYMGSVRKTGDTYFIGGGTANYVLEINYVTGEKIFEMKNQEPSYRSYKY